MLSSPSTAIKDEDGLWVSDVPQYAPEVRWVRLPWRTRQTVAPGMLLAVLRGRSLSFGWFADVDTEVEAGDGASDGEAHLDARQRLVAAVHHAADLGVRTLLVPDGRGGREAVDTALC